MADYDGYLPSTKVIGIYDTSFVSNLYPGDAQDSKVVLPDFTNNAQSMVKMAPIIANFIAPELSGIEQINTRIPTDDFRDVISPIKMVRINSVALEADFVPLELSTTKEYSGTILSGLSTTTEFAGVISGGNQTEIKYMYRTVGSPRRYPLEITWNKSKSEEALIIDEVDGDVDE